jgi:Rne/Rng family ribonuclease
MAKELLISSSPHETKVAVLEDDQLVEVYIERESDAGLVGGIYKGRVNRVLPGMQSAFVDVGLERDAFLYVSDFFLDQQEDFDKIFEEVEGRASKAPETALAAAAAAPDSPAASSVEEPAPETKDAEAATPVVTPPEPPPAAASASAPEAAASTPTVPTPTSQSSQPGHRREDRDHWREGRGRRRRRRGGRPLVDREPDRQERRFPPKVEETAESQSFEVLPGESLAKYRPHESAESNEEQPAALDEVREDQVSEVPPASEKSAAALGAEEEFEPANRISSAYPYAEQSEPIAAREPEPEPMAAALEPPAGSAEEKTEPMALVIPGSQERSARESAAPAGIPAVASIEKLEPAPAESALRSEQNVAPITAEPEPDPAEAVAATAPEVPSLGTQEAEEVAAEELTEGEETGIQRAEELEAEEDEEVEETEAEEDLALSTEADAEEEMATETASGAATEENPAVPGAGTAEVQDGDGRTYTLREHHQRPRFAPRRGRRGRRGGRPRYEASRPGNNQPVQISEILKEGQEILVQIAKEPLGTKGARITSHVALPGRYLVYMPTITHIGVSRKIASEDERLRLRNIILENRGSLTGGFIVRTAGAGRPEEEFKADIKFLTTVWNEIKERFEKTKAPALIHRDLNLVERLLRDILTPDFKLVRVDSEADYERVIEFVNRCQPSLIDHVKLYSRETPLFEEFGVQAEIDKALKPKVWLKSGGYIVINQTEALVAIDVNTGKFVGKTNRLEDTIVKTNIDAVNEIVRQVRLRDLGGIIVVDFIDMDERKNRLKVIQSLEEALRRDRAPTKVVSFHDFGLVAITRKRVKQSLERTLCSPCSYCSGSGWIKSIETVCFEILNEAKKMARHLDGDILTLRVNPEVAKAVKSREGSLLAELEMTTRKDVIIKSDPTVHQERFEIY